MALVQFTLERSSDGETWSQFSGFPDGEGGTTATISTPDDGEHPWEIPHNLDPTYRWRIISYDPVTEQETSQIEFGVSGRSETVLLDESDTPLTTSEVQILNFGDQIRMANGKNDAPTIYLVMDRNHFWGDVSESSILINDVSWGSELSETYSYAFTPNQTHFPNPNGVADNLHISCLLYTSPSPRD